MYGLQVQRAVYADLAALFVPLRLASISGEPEATRERRDQSNRPSLADKILAEDENYERDEVRAVATRRWISPLCSVRNVALRS